MKSIADLFFGIGRRLPLILQTEATECGLACLGMISGYHGHLTDMRQLRSRFNISLKGTSLSTIINIAGKMNLSSRPLKLNLESMRNLKTPCVLHWNFNHFVVLEAVSRTGIVISDPASGKRKVNWDETSKSFTGVALEIWPCEGFIYQKRAKAPALRKLVGNVTGLGPSLFHVLTLALCIEVFAVLTPLFLQWVLDDVIVAADRDLLITLVLAFLILGLMQHATTALRSWALLYVGTTINLQWRSNVFTHLLRLPVSYFERRHVGDIVSRFGSIETIQHTLTSSFIEGVLDGLMTIFTIIIMFFYSPQLATVAVSVIAAYGIIRGVWYQPLRASTEENISHSARQQTHFLESVRGIKTIKLFQRNNERSAAWLTNVVDEMNAGIRTQRLQISYKFINSVLFNSAGIIIIWAGARSVIEGSFTAGALIAFNSYKMQFDGRATALIDRLFELKMLRLQGERLADIVLTEPEESEPHIGATVPVDKAPSIEFRGVRFRYSEHEPYVLDGVSFIIPSGASVAVTGPSGCGKTTLVNILLGIFAPTDGEVLIAGVPLKNIALDERRSFISTVLQDDTLFAGSLSDNISCFDPNGNQEWIFECAKNAAILDEISRMPMGFNTLVGDMGTVLSGGQRQRILLARALYKRPSIMILDEATSSLDIAREHEVNAAIGALRITRLLVAHRLETIASAQYVVVLNHGKVVLEPDSISAI